MADYISKFTGAEIDDAIDKARKIVTSGNGTQLLSNDGTYKTIDIEFSKTSTNPVQNRVINEALDITLKDEGFPESLSIDNIHLLASSNIDNERYNKRVKSYFIINEDKFVMGHVCSAKTDFSTAEGQVSVLVGNVLYKYRAKFDTMNLLPTEKIDLANLGGSDCNTVILEDTLFPNSLEVQTLQKLLGEVSTDVEITSSVVIWNNSNGTFGQLCARSYADRTATSVVGDIIYKYKLEFAADEWMVDTTKIESVGKEYVDDKVGDISTALETILGV